MQTNFVSAALIRDYIFVFNHDMTSAELIGAYRKLVDSGEATEAEECAFLDLINPFAVQ